MVSRTYPAYHSKKGQHTYFVEKILGEFPFEQITSERKIHTFRANFPLWEKRINEVLAGNAEIVLKYHSLGRYVKGNKQIEFARLDKDSGVGVQEISFPCGIIEVPHLVIRKENKKPKGELLSFSEISRNDGLDFNDYKCWFEKGDYDLKDSFACIHFTSFRYGKPLPTPQ